MRMMMKFALATVLTVVVAAPVYAVDNTKTVKTTKLKNAATAGTTGTVTTGGTNGGNTVSELTSWDCKAVGGTVVTVGDDRCGSSRKYCRMPDTNAVCIEEKLQ